MALANSSLAMAADAVSDALETALTDIRVIVDTPSAALKALDAPNTPHLINVFFYRVSPSQFHAAQTYQEPLMVRLAALLTPFPKKTLEDGEDYPALRILGEVMRHFHENPISAVLATPQGQTSYQLQTTLMAPTMEELNHIWTTQNSELSYRLSAAYEFALLPIDPRVATPPDSVVQSGALEIQQMDDTQADVGAPLVIDVEAAP